MIYLILRKKKLDIRVNIKLRYLIDIFDTINVGNPNHAQGIATFTSKLNVGTEFNVLIPLNI